MAATAWSSLMVMKKSTLGSRKRQASGDVSPHARPAITESTEPAALAGLPSKALWYRQSACSGSTMTNSGRCAP
ncbi:hypothetical protein D3C80_373500 [compost metagenome]